MTFRGLITPRQNPELFAECLDSGCKTQRLTYHKMRLSYCAEQKADKSIYAQSAAT